MTRRLRLRPKAKQDLDGIWAYTVETFGEQQAEHYLGIIRTALELMQSNPALARAAEGGRTGLRKYPAGSHMLYFHVGGTTIDVVRILHARMDWPRHV